MRTVSVVLCTRNGGRFLLEQLESIGEGSRLPDEILVLDDDSTDRTLELVLDWASGMPEGLVRLERNRPALGVTRNFERGIREARGEVIVLADQDDRWAPDRLERAVELLAPDGVLLEHGDAHLIDDEGAPLGATLFDYLGLSDAEKRAESDGRGWDVLLRRNTVTGATAAFRRDLRELALPIPDGWVHDEWLASVAAAHGGLVLDPGIRVDYRLHGANQIGADRPTLAYRVGRAVGKEPGRNERLHLRARQLLDRVQVLRLPEPVVAAAEAKARFEGRRAALPRTRFLRIPAILGMMSRGLYHRYASRGRWDVVRDLLQPR